jgi:hypothetical protein
MFFGQRHQSIRRTAKFERSRGLPVFELEVDVGARCGAECDRVHERCFQNETANTLCRRSRLFRGSPYA